MSNYDSYTTDELGTYLSDYHKDTYGFRPRHDGLHSNRARMIQMLEDLDSYHENMHKTFAGRETLRVAGWIVEETDPVYIQQAKWLKEERDHMQYAQYCTQKEMEESYGY